MGLRYRIAIYTLFFLGTLLFFISSVRSGDVLMVSGSVAFLAAEAIALAYLEWLREEDKREERRGQEEHERQQREHARQQQQQHARQS